MDDKAAGVEESPKLKVLEHSSKRKPWRNPGANITDYFNYGFTEESWEAYCKKRKEMKTAMKMMVDRDIRNQEVHNRPSTASDSCRLFPRRRDRNQDFRIRLNREASSSAEDRATRLFSSLGSMCPPDLYSRRSPQRPLHREERSRHSMERREEQHNENKRRRKNDKAKTSSSTSHKKTKRDRKQGRHRRKENRDGTKARRQSRRHPLP